MASQDLVLDSSWRVSLEWAIEEVPLTADDLLGDAEAITTHYEDDADEDEEGMKTHDSEEEEDGSVNEEGSISLDEEEAEEEEEEEEDGDELANTRVSVGLWQITSRRSCVESHHVTSDEASSDVNEFFGVEVGKVQKEEQGLKRSSRGGEDDIRLMVTNLAAGASQKGDGAQAGGDAIVDRVQPNVKAAHAEIEAGLALQGGRVSSRQRRWLNLEGATWSHLPSAEEDVEAREAAAPHVLEAARMPMPVLHTTSRPANTKSNKLMRCPKRSHMWVPVSVIVAAMPACESPALRTQTSQDKPDGLEARIKVHEKAASTEVSCGSYLDAIDSVEKNLMLRVKFGPESPNELLYMFLGVVYLCNAYAVECIHRQDLRQARHLLDRATELTRKKILNKCKVTELVRVGLCAATLNTLASLRRRQGDSAASLKALHKALSVIRKHRSGLEVVEAASLLNMSAVLLLDGSWEDAVTMSRAAIDLLQAHRPEAEQAWEREFQEPSAGCSGRCARLTALWAMVAIGHFNYGMGLIGVGGRGLGVSSLQEASRVTRTYLGRDSDISLQIEQALSSLIGTNTQEPSSSGLSKATLDRPHASDNCASPGVYMQYAAPYVHWGHPPTELKQALEMKAKSRTDPRRNRRRHPSGLVPKLLAFEDIPRIQGLTLPSQRPPLAPARQSTSPIPENKVMPEVPLSVTATPAHSSCTSALITKATPAGTTTHHVTGPSPRSLRMSASPTPEDQPQAHRRAHLSPSPPPGLRTPSPPPGGHIPKPPPKHRSSPAQSLLQGQYVPTPPTQRKVAKDVGSSQVTSTQITKDVGSSQVTSTQITKDVGSSQVTSTQITKDVRSFWEEQPRMPTPPSYPPPSSSSHMPCAAYVRSSQEKSGPTTSGDVLHDIVARPGAGGRAVDAAAPAHVKEATRPACTVGASESELQLRLHKVYDIEVPAQANLEKKMARAPLAGRNCNLKGLKLKRAGSDLDKRDQKEGMIKKRSEGRQEERDQKEWMIERCSSAGAELQAIPITARAAARPRLPSRQFNPVAAANCLGRVSAHGRLLSARNLSAAPAHGAQPPASAALRNVR